MESLIQILKLIVGPILNFIFIVLSFIIGILFAYLIGPWISERFKLKTELARLYFAPFKKWCADCYGEVYEFQNRYLGKKFCPKKYSGIQIIDDFREIHERIRFLSKWLAKIEKNDNKRVEIFWKFLDKIDCFWHNLEDRHRLPYLRNTKMIIEKLDKPTRNRIKEDIIEFINENRVDLTKEINAILEYTKKEIP